MRARRKPPARDACIASYVPYAANFKKSVFAGLLARYGVRRSRLEVTDSVSVKENWSS
jgi:hypothetical protein